MTASRREEAQLWAPNPIWGNPTWPVGQWDGSGVLGVESMLFAMYKTIVRNLGDELDSVTRGADDRPSSTGLAVRTVQL
jgi:hypothetical protein